MTSHKTSDTNGVSLVTDVFSSVTFCNVGITGFMTLVSLVSLISYKVSCKKR
jgi:hypothetical protein